MAALVVVMYAAEGLVLRLGEWRVSFRSLDRAAVVLAVIVVVRLVLDRRTGLLGLTREQWRHILAEDEADPFVEPAAGAWKRTALAAGGLAVALAVMVHVQLRDLYAVPDLEDTLFSIWRMAWVPHQLMTAPRHLFDANIFFPDRLTLTLSDSIILPALTAAPLRAVGVHPLVAYNLLLLSGFWLSGIALYLLVERLTGSARAGFVAALIFACYPFRFEHYSHLELQMTQWMPLALLALHLFVTTLRWRYAVALGLAIVAQLYSSMYYAVFVVIYATVIGLVLWVRHRPPFARLVVPLAAAGVMAAVLALPLVKAYSAGESAKRGRPIDAVQMYSAEPRDYLSVHPRNATWSSVLPPGKPERALFPGAAPLALGALGLVPPLSAVRWAYIGGLVTSFDASLGLNGWLYAFLYEHVPMFRILRVSARFSILVGMSLAVLAGFGTRRLLQRSRAFAPALFGLLVAGVMIDARPALTLVQAWREPPPLYDALKNERRVVLFELPVTRGNADYFVENTPFMYFSTWHWRPMVNGYSGFIPASYGELINELEEFPATEAIDALKRRGVTHITVNCVLYALACGGHLDLMDRAKGLRRIYDDRWLGRSVRVYEIVR